MATKRLPPGAETGHTQGQAARRRGSPSISQKMLTLGALLALLAVVAATVILRGGRANKSAVGVLQADDFHALAFSPSNPNVVFFGHHNGIMRSEDGGRAWSTLVDQPNFDAMAMAVSPADERRLYLAGHDVFQTSVDGGASWQPMARDLPGTDIHGFAISPDNPNHLYAFVAGRGAFHSADGGASWQPLGGNLPEDVMALAAGGSPETLYASSMSTGVLRSADGGRSWAPAMAGMEPADSGMSGMPGMSSMGSGMALATVGNQVYAGMHGGLYKSADGGVTWSKLPFPAENIAVVGVSPTQPNIVLAIAANGSQGLVYRSEDGGQSWNSPQ